MTKVQEWILAGDVVALQTFLEKLDTRIYALERRVITSQSHGASACLSVLAERFTILAYFSDHIAPAERKYAIIQISRAAHAICKQFDLELPEWAKNEGVP
jgi:hypothetical protein